MSNDQQYGGQPYDPQAYDPSVTQTWEGQTWDTSYQPRLRPEDVHGYRAAQQQPPAPQPYAYGQETPHPQAYAPEGPYPQQQAYAPGHPQEGYAPEAYPQAREYPRAQEYDTPQEYGGPQAYAQPQPVRQPAAQPQPAQFQPVDRQPVPQPQPVPVSQSGESRPGAPAEPSAGASGPAYSSPTTSGAVRLTDAQRARAEGRSPIIEPGMRPAAVTAVLGLLLAGGAALGPYGLLLPLVALQGLTAAGWFRLNGMWPARQGIALAFLGGLVADAALLAAGREHAAAAILGTLGVWVLLTLVLQLRSHADPDERMYGLMATVASAALAVLAAGHLGAEPDAVVVGAVAVAATVLARAVPLPGPVSLVASLLAGAGAGVAAGGPTGMGASGALLGLAVGVCALVGLRTASYDYPSRFVHMTAGVALPLTAAAPAVYLLGRALV
ncbi:hypothetical protein [Streptomyces filamentosus]|uniref:hypothetical protein n=1 Tax=Streptomyces filamentosus TaxID=67294 RepID=UPI0012397E18|nr:hypothetical protein [Streptomyces filamentosus]KAA6218762.1 hypothetical protein CP979_19085 [Streptomyces filamentosus]